MGDSWISGYDPAVFGMNLQVFMPSPLNTMLLPTARRCPNVVVGVPPPQLNRASYVSTLTSMPMGEKLSAARTHPDRGQSYANPFRRGLETRVEDRCW